MPTRIRNLIIIMVLATLAVAGITYYESKRTTKTAEAPTKPVAAAPAATTPAATTPAATTPAATVPATTSSQTAITKLDINNALDFAKKEGDFATKLAHEQWDAGAVLFGTKVFFENGLDPSKAHDTYYFKSAKSPLSRYYWTITIDQKPSADGTNKYTRVVVPVEDAFEKPVAQIPFDFWKINYLNAVAIANENGGSTFTSSHKAYNITALLSKPIGQHLFWKVTYEATDKPTDTKTVQVDATAGNTF